MPITISAYRHHINKQGIINPGCFPFDTYFETEMMRIKTGYYADIINQCRQISDHAERNLFKAQYLPSLTISAVCKDWRNEANIVQHTGLITFDIDKDHNPNITDWPKLRDQIFISDKVVCCFLSASGNGLAFVLKILPAHHKDVFYSIEYEFKTQLNIIIDKSGKDLVRLRFISHDPGLLLKDNISEVPITLPNEDYIRSRKQPGKISVKYSSKADSYQTFHHAVEFAKNKLEFADGTKHWHLVHVAGYCNTVGMSKDCCIQMALNYYSGLTTLPDDKIIKPIENVYKSYRSQFASKELPKPPYSFRQVKWLLKYVSKPLLKDHIHQFGRNSYLGTQDYSIKVSSGLLAFFMWLVAPEYTWSTEQGKETFTDAECKDSIPPNCYLDSVNNSRVWCDNISKFPITWNK